MGESDRYSDYKPSRSKLSYLTDGSNAVFILGTFLAVAYIILLFLQIAINAAQGKEVFERAVLPWVNLNAEFSFYIKRPWTLFTYPILDAGFSLITLFSTVLWLWAFGSIFQNMGYNHKIIPLFMSATAIGGIFFLIGGLLPINELYNPQTYLSGATTPIAALAISSALIAPDVKFFPRLWGGIPLWVFSALYIVVVLAGAKLYSPHALSVYGAAIFGLYFAYQLKKGNDPLAWISNLFNRFRAKPKMKVVRQVKEKVYYNTGSRPPYTRIPNVTQDRVDEILDKINTKGYNSLSSEEKAILQKASEEGIL